MAGSNDSNDITAALKAEFSRPVDVTTLGSRGRSLEFQASEGERVALARRYSVVSVASLVAHCDIVPVRKGRFRLNGGFSAEVMQLCVISLDPVAETLSGKFTLLLQQQPAQQSRDITAVDFMVDEADIEFLSSDIIDAGEIIAQYLSLEINPFPRSPGVTGSELGYQILKEEDLDIDAKERNSFNVLESLKHKT